MKKYLPDYFPGIILFFLAVIIGLVVYQDYGISWDETIQRDLGNVTYNYVFKGDQALKTYQDKALGTGFELPLVILERCLKLKDSRDIYLMRHMVTHIFFLISAFCGYVLALRLFKNQFIACLGFLLLAFNPRLYAHSFFNSKDIPFLSAFLISMLICHVAFEKNKYGWYFLLGLACGYATSIRSMGIIFLPIIGIFFLIDFFKSIQLKEGVNQVIFRTFLFLTGFCSMLCLVWPFLWAAPAKNFIDAFHSLANIPSGGKVLFNGTWYDNEKLPLAYMPVWFTITIPELWLASGIAGFLWIIIAFVKRPLHYLLNAPERNYLLYAACFSGPVIAMIVFHGVNIDDWRHLYFIYPSFVMMVLFAINRLEQGRGKLIIQSACMLQIGITSYFMIRNHPFQQVYFNSLVSHEKEYLRNNFELEYWGCSFKQGLEHLVSANKSDSIKIYWSVQPLFNNILMLREQDRKLIFVIDDRKGADYIITNFRGNHKVEYPDLKAEYSISVLNSTIMCIYKLH